MWLDKPANITGKQHPAAAAGHGLPRFPKFFIAIDSYNLEFPDGEDSSYGQWSELDGQYK